MGFGDDCPVVWDAVPVGLDDFPVVLERMGLCLYWNGRCWQAAFGLVGLELVPEVAVGRSTAAFELVTIKFSICLVVE